MVAMRSGLSKATEIISDVMPVGHVSLSLYLRLNEASVPWRWSSLRSTPISCQLSLETKPDLALVRASHWPSLLNSKIRMPLGCPSGVSVATFTAKLLSSCFSRNHAPVSPTVICPM